MNNLLKLNLILALLMSMPNLFSMSDGTAELAKDKNNLNSLIDREGLDKFCSTNSSTCNFKSNFITSLQISDSNAKALSKYKKIDLSDNEISATDDNIKDLKKLLSSEELEQLDLTGNPLDQKSVVVPLAGKFPLKKIIFDNTWIWWWEPEGQRIFIESSQS